MRLDSHVSAHLFSSLYAPRASSIPFPGAGTSYIISLISRLGPCGRFYSPSWCRSASDLFHLNLQPQPPSSSAFLWLPFLYCLCPDYASFHPPFHACKAHKSKAAACLGAPGSQCRRQPVRLPAQPLPLHLQLPANAAPGHAAAAALPADEAGMRKPVPACFVRPTLGAVTAGVSKDGGWEAGTGCQEAAPR